MKDRSVAPWLQAALGVAAVVAVADAVIRLQRAAAIGAALRTSTLSAAAAVAAADRRVIAMGRAELVWLLVTGVLFMVWVGVAYADLARSGGRHQMHPALAVLGPLIPFAALVLMPRAMDDLTRQSRFAQTRRVGWWFGAYLLAGASRYIGGALAGDAELVDFQRSDRVLAAAAPLQIAAAALLIGLIGVATTRAGQRRSEAAAQAAAAEALDPLAASGALGWYRDPQRQAEVRWWDGVGWTDQVASSRQAPPPSVRVHGHRDPAAEVVAMPVTAKLCLFVALLSIFFFPAPLVLALGLWALRDLRRRPGAPGRARAWFAVISGGMFTVFLVLVIAFG